MAPYRSFILPALIVLLAGSAGAEPTRSYMTRHVDQAPVVDGSLTDAVWNLVEWAGDFLQRDPAEGQPPSAQTRFKILYDDANLYLAYQAFDADPAGISNILARRDYFPGDWIEINIDSYHDKRTAYSFTASVSGCQGDEFVSEDGNNWDSSWDPVWEHKTCLDAQGWTAEARIPFSQLRYMDREEQVWGIQVQRRIHRLEERSCWQPIAKNGNGWVSRFGELRGIRGIRPQRQVELLPYGVARAERYEAAPGNPFADGREGKLAAGLDGKLGVTSNLTLDFTLNPDFGQVEADPAEVNLTAFETYFSERRPFFIEGRDIFSFRLAPAITGGTHTGDRLFYSRRIGRQPQYRADRAEEGYVDQPENSSILGAAKLTGKTARGLSVGVLESVTAKEEASVELGGLRRDQVVEPLTNYFVGRLEQGFRGGETRLGGMLTAVNRDLDDPKLDFLHRAAYAAGLDFLHYGKGRSYYVKGALLASHVRGSKEAITATQTAPARYFQRPGNEDAALDPQRRSLSGAAGSALLGRTRGSLMFETCLAWRSPGFEINDIGYMVRSSEINQSTWMAYTIRNPFSVFREMQVNTNQWTDYTWSGRHTYTAFNINTNASFRNNWSYYASLSRQNEMLSVHALRGGPALKLPGDVYGSAELCTDSRARIQASVGAWLQRVDDGAGWGRDLWCSLAWRPNDATVIQLTPDYGESRYGDQYVSRESMNGEDRYVLATIDRQTFQTSLRVDYAVTPCLTVQLYGAPFVATGRYSGFKRVADPEAGRYADRYALYGDRAVLAGDGAYGVDEDGDGAADYGFADPDFNVRDFYSNLVIRWQYLPGSSLYLVWSQSRGDFAADGSFRLRRDMESLFDVHPHDVFLIKVNRWFSL